MKRMQNQAKSVSKRTWREKMTYMKKNWQLYLFFLMPGLLLTIIFKYLPMGGLLIAFEDYNVIKGVLGSPWVGLEYFRRFLSSPDFMNYLMNTLKLSIYGLLWGFPVPIILALLLNRIRKTGIKKKVQLLIYMPNFISVIVLCGMVRMLLSPVGPLNKVLGISTNWMTMPSAFRTIYIASGIWQAAGWSSIMYTAALANASKELEEAATMDGANLLQQIWYVEFFEGTYPYSFARGELYNYDPVTKDARSCGTTASLCGIEKGGFEGDLEQVKQGIQRVLMMHAACMSMEGFVIPKF